MIHNALQVCFFFFLFYSVYEGAVNRIVYRILSYFVHATELVLLCFFLNAVISANLPSIQTPHTLHLQYFLTDVPPTRKLWAKEMMS